MPLPTVDGRICCTSKKELTLTVCQVLVLRSELVDKLATVKRDLT